MGHDSRDLAFLPVSSIPLSPLALPLPTLAAATEAAAAAAAAADGSIATARVTVIVMVLEPRRIPIWYETCDV